MTPQERKLLDELFDRLASLENAPRDADAVRAINEGIDRAPNALYPLVQSVLVQDEALKRADARIRELEAELGIEPSRPAQQPGFLDNMRDNLFGRREPQGSVPSVRPPTGASGGVWGNAPAQQQQGGGVWGHAPAQPMGGPTGQPGPAPGAPSGGSFLGTAAAAAAGVVGGALLMNSFRGMFGGGQQSGQAQSAFDGGSGGAPLGSSAAGSDLARQAGVDDIGRSGRTAAYDDNTGSSERAGLFDVAENDAAGDDFGGDIGGDFGGSDTA